MTPTQTQIELSDGEMVRMQRFADHYGITLEEAVEKLKRDSLDNLVQPFRNTAPARVIAFAERLRAAI